MNLHTPERGPDEPFPEYKERRRVSGRVAKILRRGYIVDNGKLIDVLGGPTNPAAYLGIRRKR